MSEYQFHHLGCGCGCNDYLRNPKDAEIGRLNKLSVDLFNDLRESQFKVGEKDAEIERLKAEIKDLLQQNAEWQKALVEAVEKRDKLITELCEALEWYVPFSLEPRQKAGELLQRAREATK
jgi:chromosome segregation ATPase